MSHLEWALARVDEACSPGELRSQRRVQELLDALLTLRGKSAKGVFGLSPGSLDLQDAEREVLDQRIRAALVQNREAFEKAGDAASLLELGKIAELHGLHELGSKQRFPLRCDPLGDASSLDPKWKRLLERLRRARSGAAPLAWSRVATFFEDDPPKSVEFGAPDPNALYEFALRYEQSSKLMFPRELAATWSIADGVLVDDMWWYLAPVKDWGWRDEGLCIGFGHYLQGSLCIEATEGTRDLTQAPVVDRDDDGVEAYRYENLAALLDLLLPDDPNVPAGTPSSPSSPTTGSTETGGRPWWKFWA
jgi:hypothetical protein